MAMKIDNPSTVKLLPVFMRKDEADVALAGVVDQLIKDPGSRVEQLRIWDQIDNLPESTLDEIAWELNIDWYKSQSMSIEAKRATIKNARLIKAHRGTNYAVEKLIGSYLGEAHMYEWWEYDGVPYTFYVLVETDIQDQAAFNEFLEAVKAAKNARSRMLGIYAYLEHEYTVKCGVQGGAMGIAFIRCGTLPHVMNVGHVDDPKVEARKDILMLRVDYTRPAAGRLGKLVSGNEPHASQVGKNTKGNTSADVESQATSLRYPVAGVSVCGYL
jgi:phage tail P2-like protein